jgi:cobyrinic acid a,c-diamide synthase
VRELDGHPMCGVLDAEATMTDRLTLGYREARALADSPLAERGANVRGHEFHYSAVEPGAGERPAWGLAGRGQEGFVAGGVHASYLHTHWAATPELPRRLVREASRSTTGVGV